MIKTILAAVLAVMARGAYAAGIEDLQSFRAADLAAQAVRSEFVASVPSQAVLPGTKLAAGILVEETASAVDGTSELAGRIESCQYSVARQNYGAEEIVLFLNSDETAAANASIRLSPGQIPLREGVLVSRPGLEISYRNGVLTQMKKEVNEGPFVKDYKLTQLAVSADLRRITAGYTKSATASMFQERVLFEMNCRF